MLSGKCKAEKLQQHLKAPRPNIIILKSSLQHYLQVGITVGLGTLHLYAGQGSVARNIDVQTTFVWTKGVVPYKTCIKN